MDTIEVRPDRALRREFARWAVRQVPKVRTVSEASFGVPARLFAGMPEEILIGSVVDGHRYVSPVEDARTGTPPPGPQRPVAAPEPPLLLPAPDGGDEGEQSPGEAAEGVFPCPFCDRELTTARGRDMHARRVHGMGAE